MRKKLLLLQTLILAGGVVFAWSRVVLQFQAFYARYGTIFKFKDCTYPNPFATACYYGALALLFSFIWSMSLYLRKEPKEVCFKRLRNFLLFGVFFAASVLTYEFLLYYKVIKVTGAIISCSPGVYPLRTPCFIGMLFFLAAFIAASKIARIAPVTTTKP